MSAETLGDQRPALAIQHISISRMEGVREPFRLDSLSSGINLIHGPNGIGKSRTATALQALIWADTLGGRAEIVGEVHIGGDEWRVELDMGWVRLQRNNVPESRAMLPRLSDAHRDRYVLTLQDLLRVDNRDFAKEIQQEVAGGYDLARVRDEMGIQSGSARGQTSKLLNGLRSAESDVIWLRQADDELQQRERSLVELRAEHSAAITASERGRLLESAREHAEALERLKEAEAVRAVFGDPLGRMSGEEYDQVVAYSKRLREETEKRSQASHEIDQLTHELGETGFSDRVVSSSLVPSLRNRATRLSQCETELQQARRIAAAKCALLESNRQRIGEHINDEQLAALDSNGLQKLSGLTRQLRDAEAALQIQEELHSWLGGIDSKLDLDHLRRGVDLLGEYIQLENTDHAGLPPFARWVLLVAAAVIGLEAILLAGLVSIWFALLVLLVAPVVWVAMRDASRQTTKIVHIQQKYSRLGLPTLAEWTPEQASISLFQLQKDTASAAVDQEKLHRWHDLDEKREKAEERRAELDAHRREVLTVYGVVPDHLDHESLRTIATALEGWRSAADALNEANVAVEISTREIRELLDAINDDLRTYGESDAQDTSQASAHIESLARRIARSEALRVSLVHARRNLEGEIEPRIEHLSQQVTELYQSLDIDHGNDIRLRDLCDQVDACKQAQRLLDDSKIEAKTLCTRLASVPEYVDMSREQIESELIAALHEAGRREDIHKEISTIEADLALARKQVRLEEALVRQSAAYDKLEQNRQGEFDAAASNHVFDLIQNQNREVNRPEVFRIAEKLFSAFTTGTYGLELDDGPDPEFLARDTSTGRSLALNELSSGTRVQLLLAIRLAFVESMEHGPQLPVILDETLGNTDDLRATAIIGAAIEIARRGRQVIYFTAQKDEIGKWLSGLNAHPHAPGWHIFDLAMIRGQARTEIASGFEWDPAVFDHPVIPAGIDHAGLHDLLTVPPIDLWSDRPDGAHLWYLVPDPQALIALHDRGIETWGQYRELYRGEYLDGVWTGELHERAVARARVIELACQEWRHGRPRPLTKECLAASRQISETFWDRVVECAVDHGWDGALLVEALVGGKVNRFYRSTAEKLEEWFREHGYITDGEPHSEAMIRAIVTSSVNAQIESDIIDVHEIDELLLNMAGQLAATRA